jgi:hypothetical protein
MAVIPEWRPWSRSGHTVITLELWLHYARAFRPQVGDEDRLGVIAGIVAKFVNDFGSSRNAFGYLSGSMFSTGSLDRHV